MEDKDIEAKLIQVCEGVATLNVKIDTMQRDIDDLKKLSTRVTDHTTRIDNIESSLRKYDNRFDHLDKKLEEYDKRIDEVEQKDGKHAKELLTKVGTYLLTALLAFVMTAVGYYIKSK